MKFSLVQRILLVSYLCIGFIPNLGAVDKIAPQWLALTILNLLSFSFILINWERFKIALNKVFFSLINLTYLAFIIWAGFSFFYAINRVEVLVNITRQANIFLMFFFALVFLFDIKEKKNFFSIIIITILTVEVYYVLVPLLELIKSGDEIIANRTLLKGVTANPNITAFSILNKLPFLVFGILTFKKNLIKTFLSILLLASIICLSAIQSRAAILGLILVLIVTIVAFWISIKEVKIKKKILNTFLVFSPFILAFIINQSFLSSRGADIIQRASTISLSQSDDSISARLRYYSHVFESFINNPIIGVGLGNWKLKSIDYEKNDLTGYVVPYHAHNDFIQLAAELGIIGFVLYLGIFIIIISYALIRILNKKDKNPNIFLLLLLTSVSTYIIDANLNFPIARPQVLTLLIIVMALIVSNFNKWRSNQKLIKSSKILIVTLGVLIIFPSIIITKKVYDSLKGQMFLLQDFNSNNYNLPLNQVNNIVPEIPNITVTTIPISSVKARYFVNAKKYNNALALIEKGTKANPYLFYSEILKSQIFEQQGELDSAKFYARKAFFGLPNNDLHATRYINLINITRDKKSLEEAFESLTYKNKLVNWKNYLIIANSFSKGEDPILTQRAKKAVEIFPNNSEIKNLYNQIVVGVEKLNESIKYSKVGLDYFNEGDYINAAKQFDLAIEANPLDYSHYENAATSNYLNGNLYKGLEQIDVVINQMNPLNGKCEYIKALIFIKMGDPIGACPLLETSRDSGFSQAEATFNQYCR